MWKTARAIDLGMDAVVDLRVRTGVQPEPDDLSIRQAIVFRFLSGRKRMLAGEARNIASVRAVFLGSHPLGNPPQEVKKTAGYQPLGRWTPRCIPWPPESSPELSGTRIGEIHVRSFGTCRAGVFTGLHDDREAQAPRAQDVA